jgi:F420-dependent oxidoreductase-like protein
MIEGQRNVSWEQWVALARACEAHGIPALFRSDHYLNLDGRQPEPESLDAWGTVIALSAITSTLRFGTMVSPITFRHPSVLAKLVVTADHVSGGRAELGIGAGWHEREHEAYGFPFDPTAVRLEKLEEQLEVIIGSWAPGPFSFAGRHYTLQDLDAQPKPVQRPHPPVIIGGSGGPRSAVLAARFGDEYNTPFPTIHDIRERRERVAQECQDAGREPIPFSIMTCVLIGADETQVMERVGRLAASLGMESDLLRSTPPPAWLIGTIDEVADRMHEIREAGVSRVMCQHLLHDDLEAVAQLGEELAPLVR